MTPAQLDAFTKRLDHHEELIHDNRETYTTAIAKLDSGHADLRLDLVGIRIELSANTVVTTEVRDLLNAAKGAFKFFGGVGAVLKWIGIAAGAIVAVLTLIWTTLHGGRPS